MISNALDFDRPRRELAAAGRTRIDRFLQESAAERLLACLQHDVPWTLAERIEGASHTLEAAAYAALGDEQKQARLQAAYGRAEDAFQYAYDSYPMVEAAKEGRDPGLLLHRVLEFLNSPDFIAFARWLSGDAITHVTAQATRYRRGHFLTLHDDLEASEGRRIAYVLNLTAAWRADWGGLLQFVDAAGDVETSWVPRYNSLALFRVPQSHLVSQVCPWAANDRLAITGWWLAR
jgi:SM-20-related protein